jgi:hypothetical protein
MSNKTKGYGYPKKVNNNYDMGGFVQPDNSALLKEGE